MRAGTLSISSPSGQCAREGVGVSLKIPSGIDESGSVASMNERGAILRGIDPIDIQIQKKSGASVDVDANASALRHFVKLLSVARMADCAPRSSGNREAVLPLPRRLHKAGSEARADELQLARSGLTRY